MGFAGQIFAARIALGLATPSSRALTDTGEMIAKAISKIHMQVNGQAAQAAKQRRSNTVKELNKTKEALATASKEVDQLTTKGLDRAMRTTAKQGGKVGRSFREQGGQAFAGIKEGALKTTGLVEKLFKGVGKPDLTPMQRMVQMAKNFHKMTKTEQNAITTASKQSLKLAQDAVNATDKKLRLLKEEKKLITFDSGRARPKFGSRKKAINEEIEALEKERTQLGRNLRLEHQYNEEIKDVATTVRVTVSSALKKKEDLQKKEAQLTKQATHEHIKYEKVLLKGAVAAQKFGRAAVRTGQTLVHNFGDSLRHTIGILTAFFFKLQQNTDTLIQFERELLNANSVFNLTRDELFKTGEVITQFGQKFGIELQNGATGLYQLASAGVTANDALKILPETLKLSMAVQGDHNTISKLTAQTLFGFDMQMSQAAEVTDKFAHAIQKSLIEYQDLSSAVKFALPFFTSTGQSIDQLLGSLQILTNRALEAGIAGRGLRQAVAEFAESVGDSEANFKRMGVEILNANGEMLQLTEIAKNFADVVGEDTVNNTELLSTLIDDLNVRGATAFIHLVQNAEEFEQAVLDTANAGGELDRMVEEQNASLMAQIQILKNNVAAIFLMRDATFENTGFLNGFHKAVVEGVEALKDLLVVETENGSQLTAFGLQLQDLAINGIGALASFIKNDLIPIMKDFSESTMISKDMIEVYLMPLKVMAFIIDKLGADVIKAFLAFNILNSIFPITAAMSAMAGSGLFTVAAGAQAAEIQLHRANMAAMALRVTLTALTMGGILGLGYLGVKAWNESDYSEEGHQKQGVGPLASDIQKNPFVSFVPWLGGLPATAAEHGFNTGLDIGENIRTYNESAYTSGQYNTINVQNLNVDPYGGDS